MRAGNFSARETEAARLALTRHQLRREQGIPTLGVLIGHAEEAAAVWREWARTAGWRADVREASDDRQEHAPGTAVLYLCRVPGAPVREAGPVAGAPGARRNGEAVDDAVGNTGRPGGGLAAMVARLWRALNAADADRARRPLALAVPPEAAARFLGDGPFDRVQTFFAEGRVILPTSFEPGLSGRSDGGTAGPGPSLAQSAPSLARHTLRAETLAGFQAAQSDWGRVEAGSADAAEIDRARSAAERFLADLLDDLPETRGLFALNAPLEFCFGPKRAEVDLLAAGLRLAVEIDGFYHFRDPEGYRRDRRKDALLQRQGYLVLRFLAEDVVVRLEEILEEIRATVAFRRATRA